MANFILVLVSMISISVITYSSNIVLNSYGTSLISDADPIKITTQSGTKYKFDPDFAQDRSFGGGDVEISLIAKNNHLKFKRGETVQVSPDYSYGDMGTARFILFKGRVATVQGHFFIKYPKDIFTIFNKEVPNNLDHYNVKIPNDTPTGDYKLRVEYDHNPELQVDYITEITIR
jgi:hypothetical protein